MGKRSTISDTNGFSGLLKVAAAGILAGSFLASCKASQDSSVKTLDAVAAGGITKLYQCKGNNEVLIPDNRIVLDKSSSLQSRGSEEQASLKKAVRDYFSALDPAMQKLFLTLGGQVMITDPSKIGDYCKNAQTASGQTTGDITDGCFVFADDPQGNQKTIFTIVHSASPDRIRYFGPQIFGYLYAQLYSRFAAPTRQGASFSINQKESMQFVSFKEQLADAFLADLLASKKYTLAPLKPIMGEEVESELRAAKSKTSLLDLVSFRRAGESRTLDSGIVEARRSQVRDYFLAHAEQSLSCNSESLAVMKADFPSSYKVYDQVHQALLQISRELTGNATPPGEVRSGFLALDGSDPTLAKENELALNFDIGSLMKMFMPLLGQLGGGGGGAGGLGNLSSLFSQLLGGGGGGGGGLPSLMPPQANRINPGQLGKNAGIFSNLAASGCSGGNCGSGNCGGGMACGGDCSSCQGGVGGSCGSCTVMTGG
ncbi:MAG: hypothetical protein RIQ81_525 [Pseudomonadota bacterium]|jgi:hypothetical protein